MNPKCNLPEEEREAALGRFRGMLTPEEETTIRGMFPQYLFFRNEYADDGWHVSDGPVRLCTCTSCGETFEAVRGNYPRGKLHNEECDCPSCGRRVTGKAVHRFRYDMNSLQSWIKTAVAYAGEDGALMIEAGNARRRFSWDELEGVIDWYPEKRYLFRKGTAQMWGHHVLSWAMDCSPKELGWMPAQTVSDPFPPNMMGNAWYEGVYSIVGLQEALAASELRYCQIMDFYEYEYAAKLYEQEAARWMVKYLGWYCHHPQIEMAVKLGLGGAVCELITDGRKNARLLDWRAATPAGFMRCSKADARLFRNSGMGFSDLRVWKETDVYSGMTLGRLISLNDQAGGTDNLRRIRLCADTAGASLEKGVRYVRSQMPQCAWNAPPLSYIIRHWEDYLWMAGELGYDLTEPTVAMPKDLKERHDAAAQLLKYTNDTEEQRQYARRRRRLEKQFAFALDGLRIIVPASSQEIVQEGQTLHHCVGGYAARHISGSTTILFLRHERRPERSYMTIELTERKGRVEIAQIHGYKNEGYTMGKRGRDPRERFAWFLNVWLDWVNDGSRRDRNGRPVLTDKEVKTA